MRRISFDQQPRWDGAYVLAARLDGTRVRCIATRRVLVDCLGAEVATASEGEIVRRAEPCRPILERAFRNQIAALEAEGRLEKAVLLMHETFFHWANCVSGGRPQAA